MKNEDGRTEAQNEQPNETQDFASLLAESEAVSERRQLAAGEVVSGRVIAISQTTAFVAVGGKGEALIDLAEFRDDDTGEIVLVVGDRVEATVIDDGSQSGSVVLKRTVGRGGHVPAELEQALAHRIPVEGLVSGQNKGGFEVRIGSARAFCPASQIDRRRGEPGEYVGQRFLFHITKIDSGGRNIVVSRRQLLEEEAAAQAARTWEALSVGAVVRGTVASLRDFGAFVDLGGIEGLIHVSELGHGRVGHPSEMLSVGQEVEAQVIKLDEGEGSGGRRQIGLSLRALQPDPWSTAAARFPAGTTARGKVRRVEAFGAFVEIEPGLEGLVHVSRMALDRRVSHPRQIVELGAEVEITVLSVDPAQRRISLSMVETARRERESSADGERAAEREAVAKMNERKSLGTFADLLAASKKDRR